jgi:hypothetical protein
MQLASNVLVAYLLGPVVLYLQHDFTSVHGMGIFGMRVVHILFLGAHKLVLLPQGGLLVNSAMSISVFLELLPSITKSSLYWELTT